MIFLHISPDPMSCDDQIPVTPYWHIEDILQSAKYVLRQRKAEEVSGRAKVIRTKILEYEDRLVGRVKPLDESPPRDPDDAELFNKIRMPDRVSPCTISDKATDIKVPVFVEKGWTVAEDLAILALLKIDESIDALNDETPEDFLTYAGVLLDAYRCLLLAERARGRVILTPDEYEEFKRERIKQKKLRISEQNSEALKNRKTEKLKASLLEQYRQMRLAYPEKNSCALTKIIVKMYEDLRHQHDCQLSPTNASRTICHWIKLEEKSLLARSTLPDIPK